jgi:predicted component of type VI protein secretion system
MAHTFFVVREPGQPDRILVWDTRTISVGRGAENDLVLDDEEISRKHAQFEKEGNALLVGDYRTGNGTYLNGERMLKERATLKPGDVVSVGKLQLELILSSAHPSSLGLRVDYSSQLKTMGMLPKGADAGRTMIGMVVQGQDEQFVVEPERRSGRTAFKAGAKDDHDFQMRELDESLGEMELDVGAGFGSSTAGGDDLFGDSDPLELDVTAEPEPAPRAQPAPQQAPQPTPQPAPRQAAPPARGSAADAVAAPLGDPKERLRKLKALLDEGLITDAEYQARRARILDEI